LGNLAALRSILLKRCDLCEEMLLSADKALQACNSRRYAREFLLICQEFFDESGMSFG
jgi:hypothetical protein